MPDEWLQWLRAANISIHERERNPELVIEVLQCYDAATHHARRQKFIMTHRTDWGKAKDFRQLCLKSQFALNNVLFFGRIS